MLGDFIKLSFENLKRRRLRSWLTMIGIFIGIAAVVALIGLGEGLSNAINAQFGFLGTDMISVTASGGFGPPGAGTVNPLTDKELEAVKDVRGVKETAGRLLEPAKLVYNNKAAFTYVASMPDGDGRKLIENFMGLETERGRLLEDGDGESAVVGYNFMEDEIFGKQVIPGKKIRIQDRDFEVVGVVEKKGNFQIDRSVLINEDVMREVFNRESDVYDLIAARFDENDDLERIKKDIEKELRKVRDVEKGEEDFSVDTPQSMLENVNSVLLGVQIFVYIIAGISILVGGIGIMNTMYTAVVERTKEIGIMKSIGARNSAIFILFFMESGFLGAAGGAIGAAAGYGLAKGLAFAGKLALGSGLISAHITPQLIMGSILFSFLIGSFFGTLPAWQASKLNPVEAIRYAK